jgi:hypothetical protein
MYRDPPPFDASLEPVTNCWVRQSTGFLHYERRGAPNQWLLAIREGELQGAVAGVAMGLSAVFISLAGPFALSLLL